MVTGDYSWWGVCQGCNRQTVNEEDEHAYYCPVLARERGRPMADPTLDDMIAWARGLDLHDSRMLSAVINHTAKSERDGLLEAIGEAKLDAAAAETVAERHHRTLEEADRYIAALEEVALIRGVRLVDYPDGEGGVYQVDLRERSDQRKRAESPPDGPESRQAHTPTSQHASEAGSQGSASQQGQER